MRLHVILFGLAALAVAGCGGPTPYQPAADGEGFAEQRLEPDRFRVRVAANSITERETVQNHLLFRAAELTLQNGFERFVVVEQAIEPHTSYVTFDPFPPPYYSRRHWPVFPRSYESRAITRYEAWAEIKMYPQATGPRGPDAYEARAVIGQLRKVVLAPKPG